MKTTLNAIRDHHPCADGWKKLLANLGKTAADDDPLSLITILDSNGLDDALWCLRAVSGYGKEIRLFAVWCARQVQHLMTDPRSIAAMDIAERFANGDATKEELSAAIDSAWYAALTASDAARAAANDAASAAAWTARGAARAAASDAASAAALTARAAASAAAWTARGAAMDAAWTARAAAWAASGFAARAAARAAQETKFREMLREIEAAE